MRIVREAIMNYIQDLADGYFSKPREGFPGELSAFDHDIAKMVERAQVYGHVEILRPSIEYLLAHPEIDLEHFGSADNWVWENDEVRALLVHIRKRLWPDAGPLAAGAPPGAELVPAPGREWNYSMPAVLPED
jgi:hypothetical protein